MHHTGKPIEIKIRVAGAAELVMDAWLTAVADRAETLLLRLDDAVGEAQNDPDLLTFSGYVPEAVEPIAYSPDTVRYKRPDGIEVTLHPGQYVVENDVG